MSHERFKMLRRNSLGKEASGLWDDHENHASAKQEHIITRRECLMLHRVIDDKSKIPSACSSNSHAQVMKRFTGTISSKDQKSVR
mmetsp:Transcript_9501/g.14327  ORF Transcript_9501/g.14327 Transcript_9501/m.14327 type:complete len:85 (+) Transcript_9501:135-389(+)